MHRFYDLFLVDRRLSIAKIHLGLGICYIFFLIADLLREKALGAANISAVPFLIVLIVLVTGAVARLLEAYLIRMPARLREWLVSTGRGGSLELPSRIAETRSKSRPHGVSDEKRKTRHRLFRWSLAGDRGEPDLAVYQLIVGIRIVPGLALSPGFGLFGWRLTAIMTISEIVYLSFLGAKVIKIGELAELVREIRSIKLRERRLRAETPHKGKQAEIDDVHEQISGLERALRALQARADVLWRQFGFLFDSSLEEEASGW